MAAVRSARVRAEAERGRAVPLLDGIDAPHDGTEIRHPAVIPRIAPDIPKNRS